LQRAADPYRRARRRLLWLSFNRVVRVGHPVNSALGPEATPLFYVAGKA
jgi:hypothetical protein